ncbi:MAG: hypothetical protein CVV27_07255 [Candidatus Melainabacteria bacterium HGW-Melainabacteria-1]|nr:MAG: hypothetical protein CVV27_07255 [Candidatus Melainabacteria bacterium HGW-Melainabacteria-1]
MEYIIAALIMFGFVALSVRAVLNSRAKKREDLHNLEDAPFDAGLSQPEQLAELEEKFHSARSIDNINRTGAP